MKLYPSAKKIRSIAPSVTEQEIALVTQAVTEGWMDQMNMHLDQFVREFAEYTGQTFCLPVSHGTDAIQLALKVIGVGPGDEVIVPDITWVASASPVLHLGATVVLADIDKQRWCLCPSAFERAITARTKAVVCVDLFGAMPDYEQIMAIAARHNIVVIEDAAEGLGSRYKGHPAGTLGHIGVYSFNATKLIMGGQGGMLVTNVEDWYRKAKRLAHHGIDIELSGKYYWSNELGYNYNWCNLNAALALAQLRRIDELVDFKRNLFNAYERQLSDCRWLQLIAPIPDVFNCYWITCAWLDPAIGINKEQMRDKCLPYNVDIRPFFYPLSEMPPFKGNLTISALNTNSYNLSGQMICLPSGYDLTATDVTYVCDLVKMILNQAAIDAGLTI